MARPNSGQLLNRAFAAGAGMTAVVVAVTGVFIAHISSSYAASHSSGSTTNTAQTSNNGQTTGGGQLSGPQQDQSSVGGSHGS